MTPAPTVDDAGRIARDVLGEPIASVKRFTTGAGNRVYDITTERGRRAVVRFMRTNRELDSGVYWSRTLRPLGVPLPELIAFHRGLDEEHSGWMVLERLSGADLEHVCASLTPAQKLSVLDGVMRAQAIVRSLPPGRGFGYANMPDEAPHATWYRVIAHELQRSRRRITEVGAVDPRHVERVERLAPRFDDYFATIRPIPFLDDTTTRNVIVDDGNFQGIVDVDGICYGDPLIVPSLTRMALLSLSCDTIYTDAWLYRLSASTEQRRVVDFYTAVFCINFLGEQGQQFNLDAPPAVDPREVNRLTEILELLVARIA